MRDNPLSSLSFLFYIFLLFFAGCFSNGRDKTVDFDDSVILEGKKYAKPISGLPSSVFVTSFLSGFQKMVSEIIFYSGRVFPAKLSGENELIHYSLSDLYSFFLPDNLFFVPDYCNALSCPTVLCKIEGNRNTFSINIDVKGNCFNDVFSFSGSESFASSLEFEGGTGYRLSYHVIFDRWNFRGVETDEYVSYSGNVSFSATKNGGYSFATREIDVRGISQVDEKKENINAPEKRKVIYDVDFHQRFSFFIEGNLIRYEFSEVRNPFCFANVNGIEYNFKCHSSFTVKKIEISGSGDQIHVSGNFFEAFPHRDEFIWISGDFSVNMKFRGEKCFYLSGDMNFQGSEKLSLHFDKDYGDKGCDFTCPNEWEWYDANGKVLYKDKSCLSY